MTHAKNRVRRLPALLTLAASALALFTLPAQAAVPGITPATTGVSFNLVAADAYTIQPDGATLYSWGYGCAAGSTPTFVASGSTGTCPTMQTPGPTLVVTEGQVITVTLANKLPKAAGNTSIVFPGFVVTATGGAAGLLAQEATPTSAVTYTFTATKPGTYAYYSGSQSELQIEMGMFGAIIVRPTAAPTGCAKGPYSLAASAYDNAHTCYDREYLFQFSEADARVHQAVDDQKTGPAGSLNVPMDPYQPQYFLVNGRSMPDDMDAPFSVSYAHQPYNGNPHMHPGDLVLMRIIGQGRIQHPFHFHGNHARVLARDGNLLVNSDGASLAGPLLFTTPTVPGQTQDQIFTWTGQGLNWDVYGLTQSHTCNSKNAIDTTGRNKFTTPASAYDPTSAGFDGVTHEWCPDHGKVMPVAPPDPQAVANGLWYGGTPYLGMQSANPTPLPPGAVIQNPDAGYAYMWHSHNEREITTNNVFPGGLLMMLIIDPPTSTIDETL
jgi:FtsP/CotA-like multicopper oxidase with cupredoxin domain